MQLRDRIGFDATELRQEELAEEGVIPEPPPPSVEGHQKDAGCLQVAEQGVAVITVEHRVTQWCSQGVEHGGSPQEPLLLLWQVHQGLLVEVVGDEAIIAGDRDRAAVMHDRGSEEDTDRPPFGAFDDLVSLVCAERHFRVGEDLSSARGVEREVERGDLQRVSECAGMGHMRLLGSARRDQLRTGLDPTDHDAEHIVARGILQLVKVVEHEHERGPAGPQRRREQRRRAAQRGAAVRSNVTRDVRRRRRDPGVGGGEHGQQGAGVVIESVERDPGNRPRVGARPLGQERRLPISGGRGDGHDTATARSARVDEVGSTDRRPPRESRGGEFDVEQLTIEFAR